MHTAVPELPVELAAGDLVTRYTEYGDMAIRHATVPPGTDMTPVLQGLPGDRCTSPHWGIVLDGSIEMTHADGTTEVVRAGDVYYWPVGHTGFTADGVVFIEVGPVAQMREFGGNAKRVLGL
jgi:hypothetical protein